MGVNLWKKLRIITFTAPLRQKSMKHNFTIIIAGAACALLLTSCREQSVKSSDEIQQEMMDSSKTAIFNVSGILFSIPSPVQTTLLVKKSGATYDESMLNDPAKHANYSSNTQKALNAGVYGTDMAYASVFDDGQAALRAYKALDHLAEALGISGAVDPELLNRIASNAGNTDSLLMLSGRFYSEADDYLKENERYDIAALVLTGGWIESTYITSIQAAKGNKEALARMAEQKPTIKTIKDALAKTCDADFLKGDIYKQITTLADLYEKVEHTYTYVEPETLAEQKTTILRSSSSYTMSNELMTQISEVLSALRNNTIQ
jgi:hypothetical protein